MVLAGLQGPGQTLFPHFATGTDLLGTLDLGESRASVTDGEEKLRVLGQTSCVVAPVHSPSTP